MLQTEIATVGEVISGTTLSALPLNGRNIRQLSLLAAGRRHAESGLVHQRPQLRRRGRPYVNGNREQTNNYRSTAST